MKTKAPDLDDVARLVLSTTARHDLAESCRTLDDIVQACYGHQLFTIARLVSDGQEIERLYSSNTTAYPLMGRKEKQDTVWGRVVYDEGKILVSRTIEDLTKNFPDFETILGLGIRSMINVPVIWDGKVLGSTNISHSEEGYFQESDVTYLGMLVGIVAPVIGER